MKKLLLTLFTFLIAIDVAYPQLAIRHRLATPRPADSLDIDYYSHKRGLQAGTMVFGINMGVWAFDRYIRKADFAYINGRTIKDNLKHGFVWDNDAMGTTIPFLVTFSIFAGIIGAFATCWFGGIMSAVDLEYGLQYMFVEWFIWCGIIKSLFFAFIIASVSAFFGYTVEGGSIEVGKASTDSVVCSSVLILFADLILTKLLMG